MLEKALIALLGPLVANRIWFNTIPSTVTERKTPFVIAQIGSTSDGTYVDGSLMSGTSDRLQLWVWSAQYLDTSAATRQLRLALAGLNEEPHPLFRGCELNNRPSDDFNETLNLHGKRIDVTVFYADPDAPLP